MCDLRTHVHCFCTRNMNRITRVTVCLKEFMYTVLFYANCSRSRERFFSVEDKKDNVVFVVLFLHGNM